ncbi:MAG: hypothetical protein QF824_04150 [Candidatus Woesearchaeota archaeon]|jgi:hypothetical protein|nr:hypothetical protein [Candidatus Woesearchaeota archaeon]|tara:strand:- start:1201 stop:1347 length:147 start_codon:yes stop_codon:yes gene_type:complete
MESRRGIGDEGYVFLVVGGVFLALNLVEKEWILVDFGGFRGSCLDWFR